MKLSLKNQTIYLLPQRAVYWKEQELLIVADLHLGKAAALQRAGIAVPEGALENDLVNLEQIIDSTDAKRCVIVGDLIHSKTGLTIEIISKFSQWLNKHSCRVDLVLGNHDHYLIKNLPAQWCLIPHHETLTLGPFCFSHLPMEATDLFVWSGHIHPQIVLKNRGDSVCLRCFQISANQGILPAFSTIVGGHTIKKDKNSRIFVTTGSEVIEI